MRSKKLSPRKATTEKKILTLKRDNVTFDNCNILVTGGFVSIWGNTTGEHIKIPHGTFNKIIDWYNKEQSIE